MHVGLIAPPWVPVPPPAYGGTESLLDRLARGLQVAGHDVTLFATGDSTCPVPSRWVHRRAEHLRMGMALPEIHHVLQAYAELSDCDVIHDHTLIGPLYASGQVDVPVVTTNHGPFNAELTALYRAVADTVPVIAISHSQAAAADLPIAAVIHHAVDTDTVPVGSGDGGYFLFLGRMAPEKGARRAARIAQAAGVRLLLAAKMREPLEVQYFEDQVRPLLGTDVEFVGEVGGDEKVELLAGAEALINPIRWPEPFGLVMIEALACGTPVLAYREGAAPEIVDDGVTGFLCDDSGDMTKRISDVASLSRAACREAAETRFSVARMVDEHVAVYTEAVRQRADAGTR